MKRNNIQLIVNVCVLLMTHFVYGAYYPIPVATRIQADRTSYPVGAELSLKCEIEGFPDPTVHWTKDGVPLQQTDRTSISDLHRLTIAQLSVNDSGVYTCHAANDYSSASSTVQINVEGLFIDPRCTDNPFFANCTLIVKAKFCRHKYYSDFCCRSCTIAGQLSLEEMMADDPGFSVWKKK